MSGRVLSTLAMLAMASLLAACGPKVVNVSPDFPVERTAAAVDKVPLGADLYLSQGFRNYRFIGVSGALKMPVLIGEAMSGGAERVMKDSFSSVNVLSLTGAELAQKRTNVLVTAAITDASLQLSGPAYKWDCLISSRWTVSSPENEIVYMNTFTGQVTHSAFVTAMTLDRELAKCMQMAIRQHYEHMLVDITTRPWWSDLAGKGRQVAR